ncbi:hypothetical protein HXX76_012259 [Chlamydomonas incerta]|uniref:Uncharacterized protein n=1 Tax=Chlamydomonas incerta TaxID=51695 RepID=A0A835SVM1_CHLIN|nr:hypothetical protein HXX76_012259 [Chlamydomonas incerta]|eukprot:KAG2427605.1 hypothetical protein HXX76_012259 [Chlamydomonas incerta]
MLREALPQLDAEEEDVDENLKTWLQQTDAWKASASAEPSGIIQLGPYPDHTQCRAALAPYVTRYKGHPVPPCTYMVLKRLEISGPSVDKIDGIVLQDYPGTGDNSTSLAAAAARGIEEGLNNEAKILVMDIGRTALEANEDAIAHFMASYVKSWRRLGEGKFMVVYSKSDLVSSKDMLAQIPQEHRAPALQKQQAMDAVRTKLGQTEAEVAKLKCRRNLTEEEAAELVEAEDMSAQLRDDLATREAQFAVKVREMFFARLRETLALAVREAAQDEGVQDPMAVRPVPVFFINSKMEIEAEGKQPAARGNELQKLRDVLEQFKKERRTWADVDAYLKECEIMTVTFANVLKQFAKLKMDVRAELLDYDNQAKDAAQEGLEEANRTWLDKLSARVPRDGLVAKLDKAAKRAAKAMRGLLAPPLGDGVEWLQLRLNYLRRIERQTENENRDVLASLLDAMEPLAKCWEEEMVHPILEEVKSGFNDKSLILHALREKVDAVVSKYNEQYPVSKHIYSGFSAQAVGVFKSVRSRLGLEVSKTKDPSKELAGAGLRVLTGAVHAWLTAAVRAANQAYPAGGGTPRATYAQFLKERLQQGADDMIQEARGLLVNEADQILARYKCLLRPGPAIKKEKTNGAAGGVAGPSNGAGGEGSDGAAGPSNAAGSGGSDGAAEPSNAAGSGGSDGAAGPSNAAGSGGSGGAAGPSNGAGGGGAGSDAGPSNGAGGGGAGSDAGPSGGASASGGAAEPCLVMEVCKELQSIFSQRHTDMLGTNTWCKGAVDQLQRYNKHLIRVYNSCIEPVLKAAEQQEQQQQAAPGGPAAAAEQGAQQVAPPEEQHEPAGATEEGEDGMEQEREGDGDEEEHQQEQHEPQSNGAGPSNQPRRRKGRGRAKNGKKKARQQMTMDEILRQIIVVRRAEFVEISKILTDMENVLKQQAGRGGGSSGAAAPGAVADAPGAVGGPEPAEGQAGGAAAAASSQPAAAAVAPGSPAFRTRSKRQNSGLEPDGAAKRTAR